MRRAAFAVLVGSALAAAASGVSGQSVIIRVTAAESGVGLPGAFVSLLDENGLVLRSALTNESGEAVVAAADAVTFSARGEMIGRQTQVSPPFSIEGSVSERIELALPLHAITLGEIRVDADDRCRLRTEEASEMVRVWEAARTSLAVQAWTEQQGLYRLDITTWERDLDSSARTVQRETRAFRSRLTRTPFASLDPDELFAGGFVRPLEDGGHQYFGPDAVLLLSDAFLETHCFRLTRSREQPGFIGLAFEPVASVDLPDIEGTLWLDESSGHLRFLEFRYTRSPYREARGVAGGRVEFEAMPDGSWIVRRWWIRAPMMGRYAQSTSSALHVAGIRETGGEVIGTSTMTRGRIARAERGILEGIVWDSTSTGPLRGATVYLAGTPYTATTDDQGRFELRELPAGVFSAGFTHPRLDTLGIAAPEVAAEIGLGRTTAVALVVPSFGTILLASCHEQQAEVTGAAISGVVRDRTRGEPIPGATVRVEWQVIERTTPRIEARDEWFEVQADRAGRYTACGIPIDKPVRIRPSLLSYRGGAAEIEFSEESHRSVDLEIELVRDAIQLAPVVVTAERRQAYLEREGFFRRRQEGLGTFVTPETLEQRRPRQVSDVLFGMPGIHVGEPSSGVGGRAISFRSGIRPGDTCWPMVYLDRTPVSTGGLASAGAEPANIDALVAADDVWAMELFRGAAEIPPGFSGRNASCGVIVIWTRRGDGS